MHRGNSGGIYKEEFLKAFQDVEEFQEDFAKSFSWIPTRFHYDISPRIAARVASGIPLSNPLGMSTGIPDFYRILPQITLVISLGISPEVHPGIPYVVPPEVFPMIPQGIPLSIYLRIPLRLPLEAHAGIHPIILDEIQLAVTF